jgi:hypothetical protein
MRTYAKKEGVLWAIDTDVKVPSLKEVTSLNAEGSSISKTPNTKSIPTKDGLRFPVLPVRDQSKDKLKIGRLPNANKS